MRYVKCGAVAVRRLRHGIAVDALQALHVVHGARDRGDNDFFDSHMTGCQRVLKGLGNRVEQCLGVVGEVGNRVRQVLDSVQVARLDFLQLGNLGEIGVTAGYGSDAPFLCRGELYILIVVEIERRFLLCLGGSVARFALGVTRAARAAARKREGNCQKYQCSRE